MSTSDDNVTHKTEVEIFRRCEVTICEGLPEPTREEVLSKSQGMDAILWATHEPLNAEALDRAGPQLKVISTKSAGIDYVDVAEVKRRGIPLGHTPNVLSDAVADLAIGLMISAGRRFHEGNLKILRNDWVTSDPQWMLGHEVRGSTVGIVGFGGIGQKIAKRLQGFDVAKLVYSGHHEKPEGIQLFWFNSMYSTNILLKADNLTHRWFRWMSCCGKVISFLSLVR